MHARACPAQSEGLFCALCMFERHAKEALANNRSPLHPKPLLKHLKQIGGKNIQLGRQEDAHEFLLHFLDACHKAALSPFTQNGTVPPLVQRTTLIHQLFGGYLRSRVVCQECKHESNTFDPFLDLSLEVRNASTLEKALEGFTKSELLSGPTRYCCKKCEQPVDVTKRFFLHALPPLLVFQLKRFEFSQGSRGKIMKNVSFGTSVDLARFTGHPGKKAKYRLYAVIVHQGHSAKSGHYYAFVRHCSGTWYHFDDAQVRPVSEQQVLRVQAYLLFYEVAELPPDLRGPTVNGSANAVADAGSKPAANVDAKGLANGTSSGMASVVPNGVPNGIPNGIANGAAAVNGVHRLPPAEGQPKATAGSSLNGSANVCKQPEEEEEMQAAPPEWGQGGDLRGAHAQAAAAVGTLLQAPASVEAPSQKEEALAASCRELRGRHPCRGGCKGAVAAGARAKTEKTGGGMADMAADSVKVNHRTQYGRAEVSRWEEDAAEEPSQAFLDAQRALQPGPARRDQLDKEYDVGKLKHKAKKAQVSSFAGKSAFDKEQNRREKSNAAWGKAAAALAARATPATGDSCDASPKALSALRPPPRLAVEARRPRRRGLSEEPSRRDNAPERASAAGAGAPGAGHRRPAGGAV
eukprot:CAMPEP_0171226920 /NCGR_PEP_ID=MMETSP0790-20130122/37573_1 /TAXON_ID=2925 /ORGANISM="Alexandrium catenella, Strain OF101" /LENGTH=635 /DNA_ID=CAMNT_0011693003 /DNA_START=83 /DNA_END=1991 /DNA_ORIENTATION=-